MNQTERMGNEHIGRLIFSMAAPAMISMLINALYNVGITMNEVNPDYVVVGDTRTYNFEKLERAVALVRGGARLIGTNPDLTGPVEGGIIPATRALIAPIELATGKQAYFVGKPNPLMMRHALK